MKRINFGWSIKMALRKCCKCFFVARNWAVPNDIWLVSKRWKCYFTDPLYCTSLLGREPGQKSPEARWRACCTILICRQNSAFRVTEDLDKAKWHQSVPLNGKTLYIADPEEHKKTFNMRSENDGLPASIRSFSVKWALMEMDLSMIEECLLTGDGVTVLINQEDQIAHITVNLAKCDFECSIWAVGPKTLFVTSLWTHIYLQIEILEGFGKPIVLAFSLDPLHWIQPLIFKKKGVLKILSFSFFQEI